jgi:hypothetical protein
MANAILEFITSLGGSGVSGLSAQIRDAIAGGGINIAIYMIGDPESNNDKEFKRQADTWAGNHGAFGLAGATVKKDLAMPLNADPGKLVTNLLAALKKELGSNEAIPIANVALFSHGESDSMKIHAMGKKGGEGWVGASSNVVKDFAAAVKPALTAHSKIQLYACNTAKDLAPGKGRDDKGRKDDFAESLQEMTGAEVWGHETAAHATGNPKLVEVTDTNADHNAERYQLRDVLARKFLLYVDPKLTEPQLGYLEQTLKISAWIDDSMLLAKDILKKLHEKIKLTKQEVKQVDNYQVFIEEISVMGYDELFDLLIPDTPPDAAVFKKLFPEHDEIDKLVAGAAAIHAQFHKGIARKEEAIAAAKAKPGFPWGLQELEARGKLAPIL